MRQEISHPLLLSTCFLALFGLAEFLYHQRKIKAEWTRKIVHIGTGIITLLFPILLHNHWQVLFLCGSFLLILLASLKYKLLPSINGIDRVSYGSILYPIVVYGCYVMFLSAQKGLIVFYLPILILAICDPAAAIIGKNHPFGPYQIGKSKKTISGSLAFFLTCLLITAASFYLIGITAFSSWKIIEFALFISMAATAAEAIGGKGTDNLTIPASVTLTLYLIL